MERLVRALRLPPHPDAGVRGHRALPAHVRRRLRHRAEGDVHVRGPRRPLARRCVPRGPRRSAARTSSTACTASRSRSSSTRSRRCTATTAPQRGRYREHWQLSLESIGSADPAIDAEVIQFYDTLLRRTSASTRYELQLNSIGDRNCRPAYLEKLNAWLDEHADVLDDDARQKRATSPLRVFDVKNESVREALQDAPKIGESLCDACARALRARARATSTRTASRTRSCRRSCAGSTTTRARPWSSSARTSATQGSTICGGGRYDYLIEEIGGPPTPGVGFGAGIERLVLSLELEGITADAPTLDVFFVVDGGSRARRARARWRSSVAAGIAADTDYAGRSLKGQLTQAQRAGAHDVVIFQRRRDHAPPPRRAGGRRAAGRASRKTGVVSSWRDTTLRRAHAPPTPASASRSPAGSTRAATTAAWSSSTCATSPGKVQLVDQPRARRPRRPRSRTRSATSSSSRPRARSSRARPTPSTRTCRRARSRSRSTR